MRLPILVLALIFAAPAIAQSQAAMNANSGDAFAKSDAALNTTYRKVMARLGKPGQARLLAAQRAWLSYRDKQCSFVSSGTDGGSIAPMINANCHTEETDARTKALAAVAACEEGDLTCPR